MARTTKAARKKHKADPHRTVHLVISPHAAEVLWMALGQFLVDYEDEDGIIEKIIEEIEAHK
jgi:hypothetical protein